MRTAGITLLTVAGILAGATTPSFAKDERLFEFEWLGGFLVANENCPNQSFTKAGLLGRMARLGQDMGWSADKVSTETDATYRENLAAYRDDGQAFCIAMQTGRKQFGEDALKDMQVVN